MLRLWSYSSVYRNEWENWPARRHAETSRKGPGACIESPGWPTSICEMATIREHGMSSLPARIHPSRFH
ncbi:hypothetical protein SAMD00023353_0102440 [Rosellinia necatrix]|uniref:Uncharacterized protein n=1 Tax=Rosellinia necatrix TaxID=77044 RepID=A0A1S8A4N9_ROSNE|nr:hypothetical protein SAMD00023353_0102440 [Rosellinia necatrix]